MKFLTIIFFVVSFLVRGFSQTAPEVFLKMNRAYNLTKDISMKVIYSAFQNYTTKTPTVIEQGIIKKHGESQYSSISGIQILSTKNFLLTIDTADHQIIVTNPIKQNLFLKDQGDIDNLLKQCSSIEKIEAKINQVAYRLIIDPKYYSEFSKVEFYINKQTHFLEKMSVFYNLEFKTSEKKDSPREKPRMEIVFTEINTKPKFPGNFFSEQQFIEITDNRIVPSKKYSDYELINQKYSLP